MALVAQDHGARLHVRLREVRGERSLTELAEVVGMRQDELGRIERGETTSIRFTTLLKLSRALHVDVNDMFTVEVTEAEPTRPATLLEMLEAAIAAGDLTTVRPGRRSRNGHPYDGVQNLDEAEAFMAAVSEPTQPRGRVRGPVSTI